jgi:hypothetical protein
MIHRATVMRYLPLKCIHLYGAVSLKCEELYEYSIVNSFYSNSKLNTIPKFRCIVTLTRKVNIHCVKISVWVEEF